VGGVIVMEGVSVHPGGGGPYEHSGVVLLDRGFPASGTLRQLSMVL